MSDLETKFASMRINDQLLGIPAKRVKEILNKQELTRIPLCPDDVVGVFNLRGRIVTMIDICHRLGLASNTEKEKSVYVILEHNGDLYGLIVDTIGEVLGISPDEIKPVPTNLTSAWRSIASGVCSLEEDLLVIIGNDQLFGFAEKQSA